MTSKFHVMAAIRYSSVTSSIDCLRILKNVHATNSRVLIKKALGHHVQVDVKFLFFKDEYGQRIKRFQYTAIDDCTRIRSLKIDEQHNQASAIDFIHYVVDKFPFRIKTIRTDNGHEFQTKFQ